MTDEEPLQIRIHGDESKPTLIYLPGVHGDWTLVSSFRERMKPHVRFVEFIYPRTLTWSLEEYAEAVLAKLVENEIHAGIILGESYGSQVAWPMLNICSDGGHPGRSDTPKSDGINHSGKHETPEVQRAGSPRSLGFAPQALILSGGFVRYPIMPFVHFTRLLWALMPERLIRFNFWAYATFARWRHRHAPETAAAIKEFIARRTPEDLRAIDHRFKLIQENRPDSMVKAVEIPVYQLTGFWDPVVNFPSVRRSLKKLCPGYQSTHVIPMGDHNVLGTAPQKAAEVVREWVYANSTDLTPPPRPAISNSCN